MKKCPYCAELIQEEAVKCPHCRESLVTEAAKWQEYVRQYEAMSVGEQARAYESLTPDQRRYFDAARQGLSSPPPPANPSQRTKRGGCGKGCVISVLLGIVAVAFLVFLGSITTNDQEPKKTTRQSKPKLVSMYAKAGSRIRSGPSKNDTILTTLAEWTRVVILSRENKWAKVQTKTSKPLTGWIHSSLLRSHKPATPPPPPKPDLIIVDWHWQKEYDFAISEGVVRNNTDRALVRVQAVVTFKTANGGFITSDWTYLQLTTLLPGQESPFKIYTTWNPAMETAFLSFQMNGHSVYAKRAE